MSGAITLPSNDDTLWKTLPRSATRLERDLLRITSTDDLRNLFAEIANVKRQIEPDNYLPLLLTEYGFAQIAKEYKQWRPLLAVSKALRGKWGTPYAVEEMAKLLRYDSALVWEEPLPTIHFAETQLELGQHEPDLYRLGRLRRMVNVIKPARSRFRRIFHGWDDRQMEWDNSFWGEYWDKESGIDILPLGYFGAYRSDDQFLVSLGLETTALVQQQFQATDAYVLEPDPDILGWVDENGESIVDENGEPLLLY